MPLSQTVQAWKIQTPQFSPILTKFLTTVQLGTADDRKEKKKRKKKKEKKRKKRRKKGGKTKKDEEYLEYLQIKQLNAS